MMAMYDGSAMLISMQAESACPFVLHFMHFNFSTKKNNLVCLCILRNVEADDDGRDSCE